MKIMYLHSSIFFSLLLLMSEKKTITNRPDPLARFVKKPQQEKKGDDLVMHFTSSSVSESESCSSETEPVADKKKDAESTEQPIKKKRGRKNKLEKEQERKKKRTKGRGADVLTTAYRMKPYAAEWLSGVRDTVKNARRIERTLGSSDAPQLQIPKFLTMLEKVDMNIRLSTDIDKIIQKDAFGIAIALITKAMQIVTRDKRIKIDERDILNAAMDHTFIELPPNQLNKKTTRKKSKKD